MGIYLNSGSRMFLRARNSEIYVDKSGILSYLNSVVDTEQEYICVSRPRRFGKSITANMVSCFYDRTCRAERDFASLEILHDEKWSRFANRYDVIHINMQEFLSRRRGIDDLLDFLRKSVMWDLKEAYPSVRYFDDTDMIRSMEDISRQMGTSFVVVIDEWDCIFREYPDDKGAQKQYLDFLRDWFKDKGYISLAYMTGILPIKKYGTHSALNMFSEFSMEDPGELARFVGFTDEEVRGLCRRYKVDFDECSHWYNGYYFRQSGHIYNPKSIVSAMLSGTFHDYWNRTETYEALKIYIDMNYDGLRDDIISMMAGQHIKINTGSFQNDMTSFNNADDVMTLLIHLGYLGYDLESREVFIPNHEVMMEFVTATTVSRWKEIIDSVKMSDKLLQDTWQKNAAAVAAEIERAHLETSHLQYNDENALSYTISLAYYAAREYYTVIRELPTGKGFADLAFIPRRKYPDKPAMIVELKWDKDADSAIRQIREKKYTGTLKDYKGHILLVGINYDKKTRKHTCAIEQE